MADSKVKQIVDALRVLLTAIGGGVIVEVNAPLPEEVPDGGLIIIREGKVESTEEALGGFDSAYVIQLFSIEVYVSAGDDDVREGKYDALLQAIGAPLYADRSLGGLACWLLIERPEPIAQAILGAATVKAATITLTIHYETANPLA